MGISIFNMMWVFLRSAAMHLKMRSKNCADSAWCKHCAARH